MRRLAQIVAIALAIAFTATCLSAAEPGPVSGIRIDAASRGEPISKYVYGQFIEHLGRCIYGGIWAEMLEDRKFYDAVASADSPWKCIGAAAGLKEVRDEPFVGEQTPEITLSQGAAGIAQAGLGLEKGKRYVGRIWLARSAGVGPVSVSLVWKDNARGGRQTVRIDKLSDEFAKTSLEFTAGATTDDGRLEIEAVSPRGSGSFRIGTVSLMPADNVHGMRRDTLALLEELDSPIYRWPGGNFVSGYNWKDGIGDPDRRPPRKNPAWKGIEHNDFGIDEFMTFCRELNTEPLVVVNSGLGDIALALEELQYANGAPETPMGVVRAKNGHAEPYGVKFWGVGNEMYGKWQLGHMPLEDYVKKHNLFAEAMRKADSSIRLVGVGAVGPWSEAMLKHCADQMDLISEHFYCKDKPDVVAHVAQMRDQVLKKVEAHRRYRQEIPALKGKDIRIALDEYNYWYGPHLYGELGTRYFLKDALGIAVALNEMARASDLFYMANYAQTVNVIGAIKTTKTAAALDTTGLVLKLYRQHFGTVPVPTEAALPLDAKAALSADGKTLTLAVVNPTSQAMDLPLEVRGVRLAGAGRLWQITGNDPMAYNEPGKKPGVVIEESEISGLVKELTVRPYSISLFATGVK